MKKSIGMFALFVLLMVPMSLVAQKDKEKTKDKSKDKTAAANAGEEAAIKAVIEKETTAFFAIDHDTWMNSWVHAPYAYWSYVDTTGITQYEGWKSIEIGFNDYFITSKPLDTKIERVWQEVRIYGKGAFARFRQRNITNNVAGAWQTEIRILEKENNIWKIALVGVLKR